MATEYAAAAAIAEHRRLQHGRKHGYLFAGILRAAAAHDHRTLRRAKPLGGAADSAQSIFGSGVRRGCWTAIRADWPQMSMPHSSAAGPGRPMRIARSAKAVTREASWGLRMRAE